MGYLFFSIKWLIKNRHWKATRQKFKAMDKDYQKYKEAKNGR